MPILDLPLPPSLNVLWRANRGRVHRSNRYTDWQHDAGWELKSQRPTAVAGEVEIKISAGRSDNRRRDADNLAKSILDLITAHQVIADGSKVTAITSKWDRSVPGGRVRITITPTSADVEPA